MSSNAYTLEAIGLTRAFGERRPLAGVDLCAEPGSVTVLLGSNGAGKTTFMKILATLLVPTGGRAAICGHDVLAEPVAARRCLGFVPAEERSFHWRLTVMQNLAFFGSLHGLSAREVARRAEPHLATLHLLDRVDTRFGELSTGMKQSLGVIRGLLHEPRVLLLDEPTRSLSPDLAKRVAELVRDLARNDGRTVLFATHNLAEAQTVADRIALLHRGRIPVAGRLEDLPGQVGLPAGAGLDAVFAAVAAGGEP